MSSTAVCTTMSSTPPVDRPSNFPGPATQSHPEEDEGKQPHPFQSPSFTWMDSIPAHLKERLEWAPVELPTGTTPIILLLYAGKDDAGSLDSCIHAYHPELSPMICALDIRRDTGQWGQDLLSEMPYNRLCTMATKGLITLVGGGPNCRTWSILRWFPKPGAPKPVRGRTEDKVWGLPGLNSTDQADVDNDSTLLLRQMYLTSLAYQGLANLPQPQQGGSFLEHPADPAAHSQSPNAHRCSTLWVTQAYQRWGKSLHHKKITFDQCQMGQQVAKTTTISTDLDLSHWNGLWCTHTDHPKPRDIQSSDLSRYPWDMMRGLAQAIATRVRPLGQREAPQHNASPALHTSDTGTAPAGRVPLAPNTAGTQPTSPHHHRPKRSRSRTPLPTRASKGLKALTLLSSGTLATGLPDKCTQPICTTQALYSSYNRLTTEDIMEITDCPLVDPMAKDLCLLDDAVMLQVAFKSRPLRDGGGKPSPGRVPPPRRPASRMAHLGKKILDLVEPFISSTLWSTQCGDKHHPFPESLLDDLRSALGGSPTESPAQGQPFYLDLIHKLANQAGDPDAGFTHNLAIGVPLGVTIPPLHSPGIWPLKTELSGMEHITPDLAEPYGKANYPSALDFADHIQNTFLEEKDLDMVEGPLSREEAAARCGCTPEDLCPGPLAAIDEGDKIRTIYDGSVGGANGHIQKNTMERTTAPTVLDCIQAIHWLHSAQTLGTTGAPGPDEPGDGGPPCWVQKGTEPQLASDWRWPSQSDRWVLLKADVTKAHRRVKILPLDWRYQVAELNKSWWINKVGTYGMASAQLYWGRTAALILRLLYNLFPEVDWGFVFVDDFCWLIRESQAEHMATAILSTLIALGIPLSWKKTHLAEINTWLGFVIHPNIPQVQMAATKHVLVLEILDHLIQDQVFSAKSIERALGRIQWATAVCPLTKSLLQPFWAWKSAVTSSGKPPKLVRLLAVLLKELFTKPYRQLSPYLAKSPWWGCSDASASDEGKAFIGGWISNHPAPLKDQVHWFHFEITEAQFPWAFKKGDPKKRIAAIELFGTLLLTCCILKYQHLTAPSVRIPIGSDNQGNVFSLLNQASKTPATAAILMEIVLTLHAFGCSLAPCHLPRELNTWADELTHPGYRGFAPELFVDVSDFFSQFRLLPRLHTGHNLDFTPSPPKIP